MRCLRHGPKSFVPRPPFATTVQYMLHSGEFAMAPIFAKPPPTFDQARARVLWDSLHGPVNITRSDAAVLLFGRTGDSDENYGETSMPDLRDLAQTSIMDGDADVATSPRRHAAPMNEDGFIAFNHGRMGQHAADVRRAPVTALSAQARAVVEQGAARAAAREHAALRAAGGGGGGSGPKTSSDDSMPPR